jgi:hypothetical protein
LRAFPVNGDRQDPYPRLDLRDGAKELVAVLAERFEADDRARATTLPTGDGRSRIVQAVAQRPITGAMLVVSEAVVVGAALGDRRKPWCHRSEDR